MRLLYHSRSAMVNFDDAKAPGLNDPKSVHISNIDRLAIVQPRELSHRPNSPFRSARGIITLLLLTLAQIGAEEKCLYMIKPDTYIGGLVVEAVEGRGLLQLHGTTVLGPVCSKGGLEAFCADMLCVGVCGKAYLDNSTVHQDISICGKAIFRDSTVEGITDIRGSVFEAHNSEFRNCIQIASSMIELTNSIAAGIYVFPYEDCCNDLQIIRLSHGSFIQGDIIFESGQGRVLMDPCSVIDGCIYGGTVTYPGDCGCQ